MTVRGIVRDIERREVDGEPLTSFWLEQEGGRRTRVEVKRGEQVTSGETLEVDGRMNSEGVLMADRLTRAARPEPEPVKPPPPPPVARPAPAPAPAPVRADPVKPIEVLKRLKPEPEQVKTGLKIAGIAALAVTAVVLVLLTLLVWLVVSVIQR